MSSAQDDITLTFAGGAGTVTGSKYLIRANGRQFLLDCGASVIEERLGWRATVAEDGATVSLLDVAPDGGAAR